MIRSVNDCTVYIENAFITESILTAHIDKTVQDLWAVNHKDLLFK